MDVVLKYDPKADILTMKLKEGVIKDEKLLDSDVVLGFDKNLVADLLSRVTFYSLSGIL